MTSNISVTVPADDERAQVAAAVMFLTMAGKIETPDLDDIDAGPAGVRYGSADQPLPDLEPEVPTPADTQAEQAERDAAAHAARMAKSTAPPAPAPPAAPEAPAPAATATSGVKVDAAGLPWDSRIHASTKTQTRNGHWKKRKGVDDGTRRAVEAELKQLMAVPTPASAEDTAPSTAAPAKSTAPPAPTPTPAAAPTAEPESMTFAEFLRHVAERVQTGQVTMDRVNEIVKGQGIENLSLMSSRPDLIPTVWQQIADLSEQ